MRIIETTRKRIISLNGNWLNKLWNMYTMKDTFKKKYLKKKVFYILIWNYLQDKVSEKSQVFLVCNIYGKEEDKGTALTISHLNRKSMMPLRE